MAIGPTGELDCTMQALPQLRWMDSKLQQAWAPIYGGAVEWRDVPSFASTAGVSAPDASVPDGEQP